MLFFYHRTVSTWELLCLNRINFRHSRVKQGFWRVSVVTDIQNDLLGDGFTVPLGDCHAGGIDSLYFFPIAVNRALFIAVAVARVTRREALLQRQMRRGINNQSH